MVDGGNVVGLVQQEIYVNFQILSNLKFILFYLQARKKKINFLFHIACAPQPTEDSSSSPTDAPNEIQNPQNQDGLTNSILSDSDDRHHDLRLSLKSRHVGNFESDSLNENFSPAR